MNTLLIRFAIRHAGVVVVLAVLILIFGIYRVGSIPLDVFPEFSPNQVVIQTEAPGLSATLVETLITQPLENALAGVKDVERIRSNSIPGLSVVTVVFNEASDLFRNRQLVGERLPLAALPGGMGPAQITPFASAASTVLGAGLTSQKLDLMHLRGLVDGTVRPHLLAIPGVADVNVFGGRVEQWQVQIDPARLTRSGFSIDDVLAATRRATGVRGAGFIEDSNQRVVVVSHGQPSAPEQLGAALLGERGGAFVYLRDVANVVAAPAPSISSAAINGEPGIYLSVQGQYGANTMAVTLAIERALRDLKPFLDSSGVTLYPALFRPANFIGTAIENVQHDIMIGLVLVVLVLFLFLFNWRTACISTAAIPLSLFAALIVLDRFGVSLNVMVLGGLAIALGEVVDDAIIDTENIYRRLRENRLLAEPRSVQAVVFDASMEVRSSVVYATFIVALVFVPLLTLGGVAGKLFSPLGYAYIAAILASLVVALTVTPAMCLLLLANAPLPEADPKPVALFKRGYLATLARLERWPMLTMAATLVVLVAGMALLPLFSGEFIPPLKEGHYILHMTAVPGTSEQESLRLGQRVAYAVRAVPGVKSVAQWVGRAQNGADTFGTHYSEFEVEIGAVDGEAQRRILHALQDVLGLRGGHTDFAGVQFQINTFLTERIEETLSGYTAAVSVDVHGPDLDALEHDARAVAAVISRIEGAREVTLQSPPATPQIEVRLRSGALANWGLAADDVLQAIQVAFEGAVVAQVYRESKLTPVSVTLRPDERRHVRQVAELALRTLDGRAVRLADVADIEQTQGRYKILHASGKRMASVTCNVHARGLASFSAELKRRVASEVVLSPGNYVAYSGAAEADARAREQLILHALLTGVGVFLLLYLAFGSLRNLGLTFLNLPFALVGGSLAVLLTGGWLSLGSLVGFVTLFGITLRNSIMLVSHYQHLVDVDGLPWNVETARRGAAERLPSILMTALVTALGLLPLALGSGEPGREIEGPMASIIVGGLVTSTILNLLVLPIVLLEFGGFGNSRRAQVEPASASPP